MFQDTGWIVEEKLRVVDGALIVVDALLLSVLVRFAIELRAYLLGRFAEVPGLANAGSLRLPHSGWQITPAPKPALRRLCRLTLIRTRWL
jgi:hypothetical protein